MSGFALQWNSFKVFQSILTKQFPYLLLQKTLKFVTHVFLLRRYVGEIMMIFNMG